jgi:uncharacterized membrane protein YqjE
MAVPEGAGPDTPPGLFASLRSFWSVLLAIFYTRLDLVTAELEEEATKAIQLIVVSLAALICLAMTVFFLFFFLVVYFWDHAAIALAIIFILCTFGTVLLTLVSRKMYQDRPKFLSQTLAELRRDVDGLRQSMKPEEPKP